MKPDTIWNGLTPIVQEFKKNIIGIISLNTLYAHSSLVPFFTDMCS